MFVCLTLSSIRFPVGDDNIEEMIETLHRVHPSLIDPTTVVPELLGDRLSKAADIQKHVCSDESCLVKRFSVAELKKRGFDPDNFKVKDLCPADVQVLMRCKKNFPKTVPSEFGEMRAHVIKDFDGIVKYNCPRDDEYVNGTHPVIEHVWGANTDMQMIHSKGLSIAIVVYYKDLFARRFILRCCCVCE